MLKMPTSPETSTTPPALLSVRGFKDEPTVKTVDPANTAVEDYMRDSFPHSMYTHGNAEYVTPYTTTQAWETFIADTLRMSRLATANPVRFDAATQNNGGWFYCQYYFPHVKCSKTINLIIFPEQQYVVTNESSVPFKVYIRRYDIAGKHCLSMPVTVNAGQTVRV